MVNKDQIIEGLQQLDSTLDRLPKPVARDVRSKIGELRELLLEQRPPRLMVLGRRGSGKSSLINAIFGARIAEVGHLKSQTGAGRWWSYNGDLGTLDILDTRGFQEGSDPDEDDSAATAIDSVLASVSEQAPDAALFLIKAKEVDAAVDADIDALKRVIDEVEVADQLQLPIVAVVTHCDELEPKNVRLHTPDDEDPLDLEEKLSRVRKAESMLRRKLINAGLKERLVTVLGVSSYQSWRRDGTRRDDERWRIDMLLEYLLKELPNQARVEFARLSQIKNLQRTIARRLSQLAATICAGVAAVPIPVADIVPITSLQTSLITGIAYVSGRQATMESASEFLGAIGVNVGVGLVFREAARAIAKWLIPGGGSILSAAVAYAGTVAIGEAAIAYFLDQTPQQHLKDIYERSRAIASGAFGKTPDAILNASDPTTSDDALTAHTMTPDAEEPRQET